MRLALLVLCAGVLVGCSSLGVGSFPNVPRESPQLSPTTGFKTLYSFQGQNDGSDPTSGVTFADGKLYGTTGAGGSHRVGTAFKATLHGSESVIHTFSVTPDGKSPQALVAKKDLFYGTTGAGGASNYGVVFSLDRSGNERVLHAFASVPDGAYPVGALVSVRGTFYGTTSAGGKYGLGTVYTLSASQKERVLYSFTLGTDAAYPQAGLVNVNGTLYGTTSAGGSDNWGTVFSITPSGKERVLYSFKGGMDGASPATSLIYVDGNLYGTTLAGGGYHQDGVVFAVSPSGKEHVLHRFNGAPDDGATPQASLTDVNGALYGTTFNGGVANEGVLYRITTSGRLRLLHEFSNSDVSQYPEGPLLYMDGVLYGTTTLGGTNGCRCGTIFGFLP